MLICATHTVTLDGSFEWGDDSTSTITINGVSTTSSIRVDGTLYASRSANSDLTCKGMLMVSTSGWYDAGTAADPITACTHTLILNKSASMANSKYGFECLGSTSAQARVSMHGITGQETRPTPDHCLLEIHHV